MYNNYYIIFVPRPPQHAVSACQQAVVNASHRRRTRVPRPPVCADETSCSHHNYCNHSPLFVDTDLPPFNQHSPSLDHRAVAATDVSSLFSKTSDYHIRKSLSRLSDFFAETAISLDVC